MPIVIATGLAAAGQHEYAIHAAALHGIVRHIEGNALLYDSERDWVKVPTDTFVLRVLNTCNRELKQSKVIFESTYASGAVHKDDPRKRAIDALLHRLDVNPIDKDKAGEEDRPALVIFRSLDLKTALAKLMARVMKRARSCPEAAVQGVNPETPASVAAMVADFVLHFSEHTAALDDLAARATAQGWSVEWHEEFVESE